MPTMPNIVGLYLDEAETALSAAGVLNQLALGYFTPWPIIAMWENNPARPSTVLAQFPSSGTTVDINAIVMVTVASYPISVSYP